MFNIGIGEILLIAVVGLLIFGPDRLPDAVGRAAVGIRQLRSMASRAGRELRDASGIDNETTGSLVADLKDLHPRRLAGSVLEPLADVMDGDDRQNAPARPKDRAPGTPPGDERLDPDIV